ARQSVDALELLHLRHQRGRQGSGRRRGRRRGGGGGQEGRVEDVDVRALELEGRVGLQEAGDLPLPGVRRAQQETGGEAVLRAEVAEQIEQPLAEDGRLVGGAVARNVPGEAALRRGEGRGEAGEARPLGQRHGGEVADGLPPLPCL